MLRCMPFSLGEVTLLEGPFLEATRTNARSLLRYDPDRLLSGFRTEAGLDPRDDAYGGWEAMSLAGHSLGHYLSGCSLMYLTTGDSAFLNRVRYITAELAFCQQHNGTGYIGAFTGGEKVLREEVGGGQIRAASFYLNGIWAPFYTMHKIMAGLRDAYRLCGITEALEVEKGLADWLDVTLGELSEAQVQEMLKCEHGGMNEVLADLYCDTGNGTYLELAERFFHREILEPLSRGEDILPGKHGNTQIPKVIGLARLYEVTGDPVKETTSRYFWDRVVNHHSYANGSHGFHEYFGPADSLSDRLGSATSESCNVYNMLKLSKHLFQWSASPEVAGFYEKALINHILSSQHPLSGEVLYFHSLQMGGSKEYQDPHDFTCCIGTGMENHSKYGEAIYFHGESELFVTQFIASELSWREKGIILRQETLFPEEEATLLRFMNERPVRLTLRLRIPEWAGEGLMVRVNGKPVRKSVTPGAFISLRGKWRKGDMVELDMPFALRTEEMPDNPSRMAVFCGPLVLAGDLGPASDSAGSGMHRSESDPDAPVKARIPGLVTMEKDPSGWLEPLPEGTHRFRCTATRPEPALLAPLYALHDRKFTVYWDLYSQEGWKSRLREIMEEERALETIRARTIDRVVPADNPREQGHHFRSENPGFYRFNGYPSIESRYGWFSVRMKTDRGKDTGLQVVYWGGFRGPREFLIQVNGTTIATEDLTGIPYNEPGEVWYTIPAPLTASGYVTITFRATENHYAGPVFGIRTLRMDPEDRYSPS